ncbi:MAG: PAS domain-containing protein [Pseudomonadota bacterium]
MSFTFDPYKARLDRASDGSGEAQDVLLTNPTAPQELERYWASLPKVRGVPRRRDVDPSKMSDLLSNAFVLERVAPAVARIRVAGQDLGKLFGAEPRGVPLTAFFKAADRMAIGKALETAFATPAIVETALEGPRAIGQPLLKGHMILLPLRDDHGRVSRLLGLLMMSGRRGIGSRKLSLMDGTAPTIRRIESLRSIEGGKPRGLRAQPNKVAEAAPGLRLVVSND